MKVLFRNIYIQAAHLKEKVFKTIRRIQGRDDDFNNPYLIF